MSELSHISGETNNLYNYALNYYLGTNPEVFLLEASVWDSTGTSVLGFLLPTVRGRFTGPVLFYSPDYIPITEV
jgi:hypothetical protein